MTLNIRHTSTESQRPILDRNNEPKFSSRIDSTPGKFYINTQDEYSELTDIYLEQKPVSTP